ncbi:hypothetical protein AVEN_204927-1 [Araneus ventricosus]|uniref:Uncharacterized protein n=1 Tax=Araneus ventricosus TaxID=182803 RepID=A0A4Y2RVV5_ARAVE|nr:hypothetical protein AVEN_204927-1 [Araneus ventricosus]
MIAMKRKKRRLFPSKCMMESKTKRIAMNLIIPPRMMRKKFRSVTSQSILKTMKSQHLVHQEQQSEENRTKFQNCAFHADYVYWGHRDKKTRRLLYLKVVWK